MSIEVSFIDDETATKTEFGQIAAGDQSGYLHNGVERSRITILCFSDDDGAAVTISPVSPGSGFDGQTLPEKLAAEVSAVISPNSTHTLRFTADIVGKVTGQLVLWHTSSASP